MFHVLPPPPRVQLLSEVKSTNDYIDWLCFFLLWKGISAFSGLLCGNRLYVHIHIERVPQWV